jgi:hypothetical protein
MEHSICPECGHTLWRDDDICGVCENLGEEIE